MSRRFVFPFVAFAFVFALAILGQAGGIGQAQCAPTPTPTPDALETFAAFSTWSLQPDDLPGGLTMAAEPEAYQWDHRNDAPLVAYAVAGNFQATVRVEGVFPEGDLPTGAFLYAALGVRSATDRTLWLRINHYLNGDEQMVVGIGVNRVGEVRAEPYADKSIWLRLVRWGELMSAFYSPDGESWTALLESSPLALPPQVEVYLVTASSSRDEGFTAVFDELSVVPR